MKKLLLITPIVLLGGLIHLNSAYAEQSYPRLWYIEGGLGLGVGQTQSAFAAKDWCNSAGCVSGYWDTFDYPGSSQSKKLDTPTIVFGVLKFARQYDGFAWGAYADVGNPSDALGIFGEFGKKWQFDIGIGVANNSVFDKIAFDIRMGLGYEFEITDALSVVPNVFFDFQVSDNGSVIGKGYSDENGTECYNCWARGTEMLYYFSGGIKTTLRYNF